MNSSETPEPGRICWTDGKGRGRVEAGGAVFLADQESI